LEQQGKANYNLNAQTALLKDKIKNKSLMERTLYNMFYNTTGDKTNYHKTCDNMIDHKKTRQFNISRIPGQFEL